MTLVPVKITINGPITIETQCDESIVSRFVQANPEVTVGDNPSSAERITANRATNIVRHDKSWDDTEVATVDLKRLYRDVAGVGRVILAYIALHGGEGCSFEEMKRDLADHGDIQRRMNTIFLTARRMRYVNQDNKGMPPWETEYNTNGKPFYRMRDELAQVIRDLSAGIVPSRGENWL